MNQREHMRALLERSSLGTPGARSLRARTDPEAVRRVLERARERKAAAARQLERMPAQAARASERSSSLARSGGRSSVAILPRKFGDELMAAPPVYVSPMAFALACAIGNDHLAAANEARGRLVSAASRTLLYLQPGSGKSVAAGQLLEHLRASASCDFSSEDLLVDASSVAWQLRDSTDVVEPSEVLHIRAGGASCRLHHNLADLLADPVDTADLAGSHRQRTALEWFGDAEGVTPIDAARRASAVLNVCRVSPADHAFALWHASAVRAALLARLAAPDARPAAALASVAGALRQAYRKLRLGRRAVSVVFDAEGLQHPGRPDLTPVIGLQDPFDQRCAATLTGVLRQQARCYAAMADVLRTVVAANQEEAHVESRARAAFQHVAALWRDIEIGDAGWLTGQDPWRRCASALPAAGWTADTPWVVHFWTDATWDEPAASDPAGGAGAARPQDGPNCRACLREFFVSRVAVRLVVFSSAAPPAARPAASDPDLAAAREQLHAAERRPQPADTRQSASLGGKVG